MSFHKYLRACPSLSLFLGVRLPLTLSTVPIVTNLAALISMPNSTHLRCNNVLLYRVEAYNE